MSKQEVLQAIHAQVVEYKKATVAVIVEGLSDTDVRERQHTADLILRELIPALADDPNSTSRSLSLNTLTRMANELRPPGDDAERSDLDNAAFFYCKRKVLSAMATAPDQSRRGCLGVIMLATFGGVVLLLLGLEIVA